MRPFCSWFVLCGLICGCDVFIDDIGGKGEPCSTGGKCYGERVCQQDVCVERPVLGEECYVDEQYIDWQYHEDLDPCADDLVCVAGTCSGSFPQEVEQPEADLVWLRCPLGTVWTGFACEGE